MELFQLKYALTLAKHKNFSKAADELFITQPTLSQQIQRLENEIGFPIFERSNRKVDSTKMGKLFLVGASSVIKEYDRFENDVKLIHGMMDKRILFGATPFGSPFATGAIRKFQEEFPETDLRISESYDMELIRDVLDNKLDLALVSLPWDDPKRDDLLVVPIFEEYLCATMRASHPLAASKEITIEQLAPYRLVFPAEKSLFKSIIRLKCNSLNLPMPDSVNFINIEARADYILQNDAITFTLNGQKTWHDNPDIVFIPVVPKILSTFAIILKKGKKITPELNGLIQHIAIKKSGQRKIS